MKEPHIRYGIGERKPVNPDLEEAMDGLDEMLGQASPEHVVGPASAKDYEARVVAKVTKRLEARFQYMAIPHGGGETVVFTDHADAEQWVNSDTRHEQGYAMVYGRELKKIYSITLKK